MASFEQLRRLETRSAQAGRSRMFGAIVAAVVEAALASLLLLAQLAGQREQQGHLGLDAPAGARTARAPAGAVEPSSLQVTA